MRFTLVFWSVLFVVAQLPGCGASPLSLLTGGGPNVAANVQAGRTNSQSIGQTIIADQRMTAPQARRVEQSAGETGVRADRVERVTVNQASPWLIIVALIGWILPSPGQMGQWLGGQLLPARRKKTQTNSEPGGTYGR